MKAVVFRRGRCFVEDRPVPETGEGEALIRMLMSGICGTDMELLRGYYGFEGTPGHEFVGVVERAPGRDDLAGRRVVADINHGCGVCAQCLQGLGKHCPHRRVMGLKGWAGAMAEYVTVPMENLHIVPAAVPDEAAVFAEPLAAALQISQQVHLTAGLKTAVLGDGRLGLLIALALSHCNPGLLLLGRHEARLGLAAAQGVKTARVGPEENPEDLRKRWGEFDLVIEATGRREGIEFALELARAGGVVVVKTTIAGESGLDLSGVVVREQTIIGSRCGDLSLALSFLERGLVPVRYLIEGVYPLVEIEKALEQARRPESGKVLLRHG